MRPSFNVLTLCVIVKMVVSFTVRSVGMNKEEGENTVGDRVLELFLHSLGAILTSVQDTEMKYVSLSLSCLITLSSLSYLCLLPRFHLSFLLYYYRFSLFHMEYQMKTGRALTRRLVKHYRTQVSS